MKRNKLLKAVALTMGAAMSVSVLSCFAGCGKKRDYLTIMTEELNELFNPFYSTAASDGEVVGQTQLSMFTTDANGTIAYGENEACVTLDWEKKKIGSGENTQTEYYFVLKNGIKFSDGVPLTMGDVLFNMYVYLDPTFAGSSTMYSTDIVGLQAYRTQVNTTTEGGDDNTTQQANAMARSRLNTLIEAYQTIGAEGQPQGSYRASEDTMISRLATYSVDNGYLEAIGANSAAEGNTQLVQDYKDALKKFDNELELDYRGSKDAYTDEPYKSAQIRNSANQPTGATGFDEVVSFMFREGYVDIEYERNPDGTQNKGKIQYATLRYSESIKSKEAAINYVRTNTVETHFDQILTMWATGTELLTEYVAKAKDVILHKNLGADGTLTYPNISGIQSLGHNTQQEQVEFQNGKTYKIAHEHNDDGTPKNAGEYDVLKITINGVDPKAEWNFGFSVAPQHYYSDPNLESKAAQDHNAKASDKEKWDLKVDIEHNKFGVAWASFDFQTQILQGETPAGVSKNRVPVGAGPYKASSKEGSDSPTGNEFIDNNIVYYKGNENFLLGAPKIDKLRLRVVSSSNALASLETGDSDFVTPQFTKQNGDKVSEPSYVKKGYKSVSSWQLGYGYIGINAGYVPDLELRQAIMYAMDISRALDFYSARTVVNISWPMSAVSWAYPRTTGHSYNGNDPTANMETNNGHPYAMTYGWTDEQRMNEIRRCMNAAGVAKGNPKLKLKFTIAGASMTEHPCYPVFLKAVDLLNKCDWDVELQADTNALTKLSTGSLAVWAAAWGSTLDPDMYQVYHKNSTATSVYAWGYREIIATPGSYPRETKTINDLSKIIDDARKTDNQSERIPMYKTAMQYVLDLAVELPVYQRQTLYVMNVKRIDESTLAHDENGEILSNPYASPLNRLWEVELL